MTASFAHQDSANLEMYMMMKKLQYILWNIKVVTVYTTVENNGKITNDNLRNRDWKQMYDKGLMCKIVCEVRKRKIKSLITSRCTVEKRDPDKDKTMKGKGVKLDVRGWNTSISHPCSRLNLAIHSLIQATRAKETGLALCHTGTDFKHTVRPTTTAYINLAKRRRRGGQVDWW